MHLVTKLMLVLVVIVVLVAVFSGVFTYIAEERQFLKLATLSGDQLSRSITSATWHAMLSDRREDVYQIIDTIARKQGVDRIRMFSQDGRITFSTNREEVLMQAGKDASTCTQCHSQIAVPATMTESTRVVERPVNARSLSVSTPIYNEPSCSTAECHAHPASTKVLGLLEVDLSLEGADAELANLKTRVLFRVVIESLLICALVYFFVRRFINRPIRQLIAGTHAISEMQLDSPIPIPPDSGEITELALSFDMMRERLGSAMQEINQFTQKLESKVDERTRELKLAHEKLRQTDRLASLGQLSASVAHEINNPIAGVLNLSMLLQRLLKDDGVPKERLPEFHKYLGQIVSETSRVGRIVSDLLSFSRRSTPHRAANDLNEIIRSTLSLTSHKMKLTNVKVEQRFAEDLPAVLCDRSQLQQVVLNLVMNAGEAMQGKQGGTLVIETGTAPNLSVFFRVTDTGEGIRPENLKRIFDPFFTTKPEGKGVGLGLAVSYGIVQAHGGDIEVKSTLGEGTAFTVTLPVSGAATKEQELQMQMT